MVGAVGRGRTLLLIVSEMDSNCLAMSSDSSRTLFQANWAVDPSVALF